MRKEVKDLIINEIKSGKWQQGTVFLEHSDTFCIIGLICAIASTFGICEHSGNRIGLFDGKLDVMPDSVIQWAGMNSPNGEIPGLKYSLAEYNDNGKTFAQLGEIIERHYEQI